MKHKAYFGAGQVTILCTRLLRSHPRPRVDVKDRHSGGIRVKLSDVPRYDTLVELVRALDRHLITVTRALVPVM